MRFGLWLDFSRVFGFRFRRIFVIIPLVTFFFLGPPSFSRGVLMGWFSLHALVFFHFFLNDICWFHNFFFFVIILLFLFYLTRVPSYSGIMLGVWFFTFVLMSLYYVITSQRKCGSSRKKLKWNPWWVFFFSWKET